MNNQSLKELVEGWGLPADIVGYRWVKTKIGESKLLLSVDKIGTKYFCLMVAHKLHNQTVYQQIIGRIRSLGYKSPGYICGNYWECPDLDECVFFENKDNGKILQLLTDKIITKVSREVNQITRLWD